MAILRRYTFGAPKPGFRSLATLNLVVNVVGELLTDKNSCGMARFPYDSTALLFDSHHLDPGINFLIHIISLELICLFLIHHFFVIRSAQQFQPDHSHPPSVFHCRLKTFSHKSFPPQSTVTL